ncbi:LOW QUALITY PROTEIN: polyunsaturated fatty acid lipoxygenase ALOX15B-like [Aulostomus maculatus]
MGGTKYGVIVITQTSKQTSTLDNIYMRLVGINGKSYHCRLRNNTRLGPLSKGVMSSPAPLGKLILIEVDKQPDPSHSEDSWFLASVQVQAPEGNTFQFPVYHWITDSKVHRFREATGLFFTLWWEVYMEGIPHCVEADSPLSLPLEVQFSVTKAAQFTYTAGSVLLELRLEGLAYNNANWKDMNQIYEVFSRRTTDIAVLNGINPVMIRRCDILPKNSPVTDAMVFPRGQWRLQTEMQKGNIFLCDYKLLDDVQANVVSGRQQYLMAPLILLHRNPHNELLPIAIQLKQEPGANNPIFLPTDLELDWLLAKTFVRSADFSMHQLNFHLLRTHLLAEVFAVSLLRNVPTVHPLYKLLTPHTRYTLQINILARELLISDTGVFTEFAASGGEGMVTILRRALSSMTYSSLCMPEDIAERGLNAVPNYYYRDDGLQLWHIINKFVRGLLGHYYKNDLEVQEDPELQSWILDIFKHGFLSHQVTGIPYFFSTVEELVKFVTMVIFTCSCQHAAVNSGQYDSGGWMPNTPISLQHPPPSRKGVANESTLMKALNKEVE